MRCHFFHELFRNEIQQWLLEKNDSSLATIRPYWNGNLLVELIIACFCIKWSLCKWDSLLVSYQSFSHDWAYLDIYQLKMIILYVPWWSFAWSRWASEDGFHWVPSHLHVDHQELGVLCPNMYSSLFLMHNKPYTKISASDGNRIDHDITYLMTMSW